MELWCEKKRKDKHKTKNIRITLTTKVKDPNPVGLLGHLLLDKRVICFEESKKKNYIKKKRVGVGAT